MKKSFFLLFLLTFFSLAARAQTGVRFGDGQPIWSATRVSGPILSVPNSTMRICTSSSGVGVPCTALATTYTDATLGTSCPSNLQVVLAGSTTCQGTTDQYGNWGVWVPAGQYVYTVTTTGGLTFGPYPFTAGGSGGGGGGGSVVSVGLQVNGAASSGIFSITGSPVTFSGILNYNIAGNSGGLPYFSDSVTLSSSGTLTANLPLIGGGPGGSPTSGSRTGNTTQFATWIGSATSARCVDTDANGNLQITSADCGIGGATNQTNGVSNASQATLNFQNVNVFSWSNPSAGNEQVNFASQAANTFLAAPNGSAGVPTPRLIVAADIPAGTACGGNLFTKGLNAALASNCVQPSFANLSGAITLAQTPLTTNGDILSVSAGALARVGAAVGQDFVLQGANAAVPVWLAVNNCGSGTQALSYSTTTHTFGCQTITVGTGTINNSIQFSGVYYSVAGTTNTLSGVAPPTTPNIPFIWCSTPSGGVATAPAWCEPGVPINAQVGTSYTIVATDREGLITTSNVAAIAVALPQAGSSGFDHNFNFALCNTAAGLVTITPTTSTINGASSQVVPNHSCAYVYSDNTNFRAGTFFDFAAFPNTGSNSAITFNSSTGIFGTLSNIATTTNGGPLGATLPITLSAGGTIACPTCVINNGANTGTAAMTVDMSASTSASALRIPNLGGASSTTAGAFSYDITNKMPHLGANGVDNVIALLPTSLSPANSDCVEFSVVSSVITLKSAGAACGAGSGVTLQTAGVNNSSQTTLNFQTGSAVTGITIVPTNPSSGNEQMAISGTLTPAGGGTGLATLTAHGVVLGEGTSNVAFAGPSNTGLCFLGQGASSDPSFGTCPSAAGSGLLMDTSNAISLAGTVYVPVSGGGVSSGTEANVDIDAPQSATIQNLYVQLSGAVGGGNSVTITLRDNGSSVGSPGNLTCTISGASATSCHDTTDSFTVAAGDLLDWQITVSGTIVATPNFLIAAQWGGSLATGIVNNCSSSGVAYYAALGTTVSCLPNPSSNGTITSGNLACIAASNTQGNCTALPPNNFVGVFVSSTAYSANGVTTVNIDQTRNVTFGDILCASMSLAGTAHDNGAVACANGEWVGIVTTTASSVSSVTASLRLQ